MTKLKLLIFICGFLLNSTVVLSQSVIASSVSFTKNTEASMFWAIGEFVSETIKNDESILTQGFYQSVLLPTASEEIKNPIFQVVAFPNPVKSILTLKSANPANLTYQVSNMNGVVLLQNSITNTETKIPFNQFPNGLYLLGIRKNDQIIENFKIEKH